MTALLLRLLIIAIAVIATSFILTKAVGWAEQTTWPGAVTAGVVIAILSILDHIRS